MGRVHLAHGLCRLNLLERHAILTTYEACGGSTQATADALGISQRKAQYRLREYREEEEGRGEEPVGSVH